MHRYVCKVEKEWKYRLLVCTSVLFLLIKKISGILHGKIHSTHHTICIIKILRSVVLNVTLNCGKCYDWCDEYYGVCLC